MSLRPIIAATLSVLATVGTVAFAVPARAADMHSVTVDHSDLDLSSANDTKVLERRIRSAASRACSKAGASERLAEMMECRRMAIADGQAQASVAVARARTLMAARRSSTSSGA